VIHYTIPGGVTQNSNPKENNMIETLAKALGFVIAGIVIIVIFGLLMSLPVMYLWNSCLVPAIPGIVQIGWLQAWGILILSGILFRSSNYNKE
jgi:uncharacterized oligopeptide transporter (OPT) family protein